MTRAGVILITRKVVYLKNGGKYDESLLQPFISLRTGWKEVCRAGYLTILRFWKVRTSAAKLASRVRLSGVLLPTLKFTPSASNRLVVALCAVSRNQARLAKSDQKPFAKGGEELVLSETEESVRFQRAV